LNGKENAVLKKLQSLLYRLSPTRVDEFALIFLVLKPKFKERGEECKW
jgi:hypothetical protein